MLTILNSINSFVWGPVMLILLLGVGVFLTFILRFFSLTRILEAFKLMWRGRKVGSNETGEVSAFAALMTALAATIGTGNIAGVATAIFLGGPGALFWMWMTALAGMATKYAETVLAVEYREVTANGSYVGGPMYFIKNGLGPKWAWLGTLFALFTVLASFGIGNMVQSNSVAQALQTSFSIPPFVTAIFLFILTGSVLIGGLKRVAEVASFVVPSMAILYTIAGMILIILQFNKVPQAIALVITEAFSPTAAVGGFAGATVMMAIRFGVARGLFSNEAGLGSGCIAYASAATSGPVHMGLIGMLGTFIDSIIVCTITGLAIILTGSWTLGISGTALTSAAFDSVLPFGGVIVSVGVVLFAYTTILGWCVYAERCVIFLAKEDYVKYFRIIFTCAVPVGALLELDVVWLISDTLNAMMAFPNLIGLILLSPVVVKLTRKYIADNKK